MKSPRIFLWASLCLVLLFPPMSQTRLTCSENTEYRASSLDQLRGVYAQLRKSSGEWTEDLDNFGGKKHEVMNELGCRLGNPGASSDPIFQYLGKPDQVVKTLDEVGEIPLMPGPIIPPSESSSSNSNQDNLVYLVYYWRGQHDYLWFQVNTDTNLVHQANWNYSYE